MHPHAPACTHFEVEHSSCSTHTISLDVWAASSTKLHAAVHRVPHTLTCCVVRYGSYQGLDPGWLDEQHRLLAMMSWFRDPGACTKMSAEKELRKSVPGAFLVRVVNGEEAEAIPSKYVNAQGYVCLVPMLCVPM